MSEYSDLGTAAHKVLEYCLQFTYAGMPTAASAYIGTEIPIEDGPHSRLSPSGARRWMSCAAAPRMEAEFPEEPQPPRSCVIDSDYANAAQECLDYVDQRKKEIEGRYGPMTVRTEHRVSPSLFLKTADCDGTLDVALVADGFVEILDFKAGAGVPVTPDDPSLELYLLGLVSEYVTHSPDGPFEIPFREARLTICQPRCVKMQPAVRSIHIDSLSDWIDNRVPNILAAIVETEAKAPKFCPGEEICRFCAAKGTCVAHQEYALFRAGVLDPAAGLEGLDRSAEAFASRDTRTLTGAQLRQILDAREMLSGALRAAEARALEMLRAGRAPEEVRSGYKLVYGRSARKWALSEEETEKRLKRIKVDDPKTGKNRSIGRKDLLKTGLKSAPQVEKLLEEFRVPRKDARWDAFRALIDRSPGALTLAPRSDPRDEVLPQRVNPEVAFEEPPAAPETENEET